MDSLLTDDMSRCYFCGKPKMMDHAIYNSLKEHEKYSFADGMTIPLCWDCNVKLHLDKRISYKLHIEGQLAWEHAHPTQAFEKRYGRNFL